MKLTNEQIAAELQALQTAMEEALDTPTGTSTFLPWTRRGKCRRLLQWIATVLRSTKRECDFGTWQELDEEGIAGEIQALQTAVRHVLDIVATEQIIGELQALALTATEHDENAALCEAISSEMSTVEQHFVNLKRAISMLRLLKPAVVPRQ